MYKAVATLKEENKYSKDRVKKGLPIIYSRVLTNRMTIVGWKLFKSDRQVHLAFMVYRLKRDFGFTWWEVANLTGIPVKELKKLYRTMKPILDSEILKILGDMDDNEQLHEWRELPTGHGRGSKQGYYVVRDYPAWYLKSRKHKRWSSEPDILLGDISENEWQEQYRSPLKG